MNSALIPFLIRRDKKNALRPSSKGGKFHYDKAVSDMVKKLPLFLKQLPDYSGGEGVEVVIRVDLSKEEIEVELWRTGRPYKLPRHADLAGIVQTISDALEKSGRIKNDSRIVEIEAKIV